ncbi:tetratricopeptide repeat protein [bacterium]|nr:tetratricopeptide repeat protein [bacterium]MBU1616024.1 tetratricopeptide repeat protein [bacterium]
MRNYKRTKIVSDKNCLFVSNAHFHLGCIYQSLGEREKAGREFETCLKLIPDHKKVKESICKCVDKRIQKL